MTSDMIGDGTGFHTAKILIIIVSKRFSGGNNCRMGKILSKKRTGGASLTVSSVRRRKKKRYCSK